MHNKIKLIGMPLLLLFCLSAGFAAANTPTLQIPGLSIFAGGQQDAPQEVAKAFQILALLTVLSLAPAILIMLTSFTRIVIVLAMLRHGIGLQTTPPNIVIISLALFLTLVTMLPVITAMDKQAVSPYLRGEMELGEAVRLAAVPLRDFMLRQTREKDLLLMVELAKQPKPKQVADISNSILIPAFMLSELQTAFQIGFVVFLPFLLIDLVVASALMSMGMIMVPPLTISLPLKVLMFVLIDGWNILSQALVASFN